MKPVFYDMCDAPTFTTPAPSTLSSRIGTWIKETFFTPFLNPTIYRLFGWFYNRNITKSIEDLNDLVVHILLAPDFDQGHLEKFDAKRELDRLDRYIDDPPLSAHDGWLDSSVKIQLPATRKKFKTKEKAPEFEITGIHYRRLTQVIVSVFQEPLARNSIFSHLNCSGMHPQTLLLNASSQRCIIQTHF